MGYYTRHTMTISHNQDRIIKELREKYEEVAYAIDEDGSTYDVSKWYDSDEDMKKISLEYPDTLFTLEGEGANNEDMWKAYFLNGKMQICNAKITFDAYDPNKLK